MSSYEDDGIESAPRGNRGPWLVVTAVAAAAGVGMVAFNVQKNQALGAMGQYKSQNAQLKKRQADMSNEREGLEKQLGDLKSSRDQLTQQVADLKTQLDQATQQVAAAQAAAKAAESAKGRHARHRRR